MVPCEDDNPSPLLPASSLYSQGKVSYFLIPHGRRRLLNQYPKIASHSQLLRWSPSRESKGTEWKWEATTARARTCSGDLVNSRVAFFLCCCYWEVDCWHFTLLFERKPVNWKMRLNVAIFFGALFGALGVLLFLVAFGSDYWLLATEVGRCSGEQNVRFFFKISLYLVALRAALSIVLKNSSGVSIS